jgi:hypothetical protein
MSSTMLIKQIWKTLSGSYETKLHVKEWLPYKLWSGLRKATLDLLKASQLDQSTSSQEAHHHHSSERIKIVTTQLRCYSFPAQCQDRPSNTFYSIGFKVNADSTPIMYAMAPTLKWTFLLYLNKLCSQATCNDRHV